MEKTIQELSEITAAFKDHVSTLKNLADQVAQLGGRIVKVSSKFCIAGRDSDVTEKQIPNIKLPGINSVTSNLPNIIPFPPNYQSVSQRPITSTGRSAADFSVYQKEESVLPPFIAPPGISLPAGITDFRPLLQRNGLILLAWDKRRTEKGARFTAYWVTSAGIPRFYASKLFSSEDFPSARPHRKSYAAEDGIEFYGQDAPVYIVHVAPELMKSNPHHSELRKVHIDSLKKEGSEVDFNYRYLLKNDKKAAPLRTNKRNPSPRPLGA